MFDLKLEIWANFPPRNQSFRSGIENPSQNMRFMSIHVTRPKNLLLPLTTIIVHLSLIGFGLFCDISLYYFIKQENWNQNQNGSTLVPWKSRNPTLKDDVQVPLRATFVTSFLILCMLIISTSAMIFANQIGDENLIYFAANMLLFTIFTLPMVLVIFTVKRQNKVSVSQPPQQLQFHENEQIELEMH